RQKQEDMAHRMTSLASVLLVTSPLLYAQDQATRPLIIDVHLHAFRMGGFGADGGPAPSVCSSNENIVWNGWDTRTPFTIEGSGLTCQGGNFDAARTDEDLRQQTLAILNRYNIRAVTSGESGDLERIGKWRATSPDRIIPAASFRQPGRDSQGRSLYRSVSDLRQLVAQ